MRRKRRTHSPEFKSKVALAAAKGDLTMAQMVKKFDVHANQITEWKKQLLAGVSDVFERIPGRPRRARKRCRPCMRRSVS